MTNPLRDGIARVDGRLLLRVLDYISKHGGSSCEELGQVIGVSKPTVQRLFRNARKHYGVKITYHKTNQPYPGAGEFSVEDWGVFDRGRVRQFLASRGRTTW
jgi:hypothetical protein